MTEREKLQSWRIFLGGCEQEFSKALRDLSLMPPHSTQARLVELETRWH